MVITAAEPETEGGRRWVGVTVLKESLTLVDVEVYSASRIELRNDSNIKVQSGPRADAYAILLQHVRDYLKTNAVHEVAIKASSTSKFAVTKDMMLAAEARGVVICAAAMAGCNVVCVDKGITSRTFGSRKVDEYAKDDDFWANAALQPQARKGSRETALLLLSAIKDSFDRA